MKQVVIEPRGTSNTVLCKLCGGPFNGQTLLIRARRGLCVVVTRWKPAAIAAKEYDDGHMYRSRVRFSGQEEMQLEHVGTIAEQRR